MPDFHPITASTALYCVLGNPVSHSLSPLVHNQAFKALGIDAAYMAFAPDNIRDATAAVRALGIRGASVTIPFKEVLMDHLDWIHPQAQKIGAVNTIVNDKGRLLGYNTDSQAALDPLLTYGIQGKSVCIVGAGGAARAVAHGICRQGGNLIITNRSPDKGAAMAGDFSARFVPLESAATIEADVVINTTSLGMTPHDHELCFPSDNLRPGMVVMDVVYTPLETRFLAVAREKGCIPVDGLSMFVAQAAAQFELWTGVRPDLEKMRQAVLDRTGD